MDHLQEAKDIARTGEEIGLPAGISYGDYGLLNALIAIAEQLVMSNKLQANEAYTKDLISDKLYDKIMGAGK